MKDRISLIAAAAGGLMLSLAVTSIIHAAPVTALKSLPHVNTLQATSVSPDRPVNVTLDRRFTLENSLKASEQIETALNSFQQLTEKSQVALEKDSLAEISNTDSETQILGFQNWVGTVEGTLKQQDYQIQKLEFELAQQHYKDGKINKTELDQKAAKYQKSKREFLAFWHSSKIVD
jgi:hypothetical protein